MENLQTPVLPGRGPEKDSKRQDRAVQDIAKKLLEMQHLDPHYLGGWLQKMLDKIDTDLED